MTTTFFIRACGHKFFLRSCEECRIWGNLRTCPKCKKRSLDGDYDDEAGYGEFWCKTPGCDWKAIL